MISNSLSHLIHSLKQYGYKIADDIPDGIFLVNKWEDPLSWHIEGDVRDADMINYRYVYKTENGRVRNRQWSRSYTEPTPLQYHYLDDTDEPIISDGEYILASPIRAMVYYKSSQWKFHLAQTLSELSYLIRCDIVDIIHEDDRTKFIDERNNAIVFESEDGEVLEDTIQREYLFLVPVYERVKWRENIIDIYPHDEYVQKLDAWVKDNRYKCKKYDIFSNFNGGGSVFIAPHPMWVINTHDFFLGELGYFICIGNHFFDIEGRYKDYIHNWGDEADVHDNLSDVINQMIEETDAYVERENVEHEGVLYASLTLLDLSRLSTIPCELDIGVQVEHEWEDDSPYGADGLLLSDGTIRLRESMDQEGN